jgi:hypothetical protein
MAFMNAALGVRFVALRADFFAVFFAGFFADFLADFFAAFFFAAIGVLPVEVNAILRQTTGTTGRQGKKQYPHVAIGKWKVSLWGAEPGHPAGMANPTLLDSGCTSFTTI